MLRAALYKTKIPSPMSTLTYSAGAQLLNIETPSVACFQLFLELNAGIVEMHSVGLLIMFEDVSLIGKAFIPR